MLNQTLDRQVERIRAVQGENPVRVTLAVEERVEALAALGDETTGFDGLGISPASGAGAQAVGVMGHRFQHDGGLGKTGGGIY